MFFSNDKKKCSKFIISTFFILRSDTVSAVTSNHNAAIETDNYWLLMINQWLNIYKKNKTKKWIFVKIFCHPCFLVIEHGSGHRNGKIDSKKLWTTMQRSRTTFEFREKLQDTKVIWYLTFVTQIFIKIPILPPIFDIYPSNSWRFGCFSGWTR